MSLSKVSLINTQRNNILKVLVLTSNSCRHKFLCHQVAKELELVGVISEDKGKYYSAEKKASRLVTEHFDKLRIKEKQIFDTQDFPNVPLIEVKKSEINSEDVLSWAIDLKPDAIILFGTGILKEAWLEAFSDKIINIHLGFSPYYRGSGTLFWPFYNDDLEHLGVTIHLTVRKVDAGNILYIVQPKSLEEDYYSITNELIKKSLCEVSSVTSSYLSGKIEPKAQDITLGHVYKKADFSEDALRKAIKL